MPGMRTSEIIMLIAPVCKTSSAFSPEATGMVSKPWLFRNESSRLRCPASSSTINIRGSFTVGWYAGRMMSGGRREVDVSDSVDRAARLDGQAAYFPALSQGDPLDERQAEAGRVELGGNCGVE